MRHFTPNDTSRPSTKVPQISQPLTSYISETPQPPTKYRSSTNPNPSKERIIQETLETLTPNKRVPIQETLKAPTRKTKGSIQEGNHITPAILTKKEYQLPHRNIPPQARLLSFPPTIDLAHVSIKWINLNFVKLLKSSFWMDYPPNEIYPELIEIYGNSVSFNLNR
ncbi:hypothetical protein LAZ67_14001053 [Cordylochernes scorpioides]|uniref:Uncharacterized protein n=1 Tax=Cordylochernes scorpioides TaxID=51811 RepID=A0ABY6L5X8_9ARAC|nr:hypothetical protein LAZ67_14001053 [Cordylochernes scorpioides]